jgi:hypothetical protein
MVKFVDVPLDNGDPKRATTELAAMASESPRQQQSAPTQDSRATERRADVDPRFAGKSPDEIVGMYKNLESHSGRLASQLGDARQTLNQYILGKRDNDIRQNGGQVTEQVKIQPTDLMVNPTEAIDRLLASRENPQFSRLQQRLNDLEAQLGQTTFVNRHPTATEETSDPAFQAWVQQTPLRQKLAADAANNNFYAADALLTEWQSAKGGSNITTSQNRAQALATRVSLESNNTGSDDGRAQSTQSTRTLRRRDLIALRQSNPDLYDSEEYQKVILQAYKDKRVVD